MSTRHPARPAPPSLFDGPTQPDLLQRQLQTATGAPAALPAPAAPDWRPADRREVVAWMRRMERAGFCRAIDCQRPEKRGMLMCWDHWKRVPKVHNKAIFAAVRAGDWFTWVVHARAAIEAVAAKEGRIVPWAAESNSHVRAENRQPPGSVE